MCIGKRMDHVDCPRIITNLDEAVSDRDLVSQQFPAVLHRWSRAKHLNTLPGDSVTARRSLEDGGGGFHRSPRVVGVRLRKLPVAPGSDYRRDSMVRWAKSMSSFVI